MAKRTRRTSKISALHIFKLCFRSALLLAALVFYLIHVITGTGEPFGAVARFPLLIFVIWLVFVGEMLLRFFPSERESMGCQKQFKRNFVPTEVEKPPKGSRRSTLAVALVWLLLNGCIGVAFFLGWIGKPILILISLFYSVCDMICILFFCPFQTWFMKNKCCGSCRIYNWDFAMMFTPLIFVPDPFTWSLLGLSLLLLLYWEIMVHRHPERFSEVTNACLSCANCKEKLCHHKSQLRRFLRKHSEILLLKGNTVLKKAKNTFSKKK